MKHKINRKKIWQYIRICLPKGEKKNKLKRNNQRNKKRTFFFPAEEKPDSIVKGSNDCWAGMLKKDILQIIWWHLQVTKKKSYKLPDHSPTHRTPSTHRSPPNSTWPGKRNLLISALSFANKMLGGWQKKWGGGGHSTAWWWLKRGYKKKISSDLPDSEYTRVSCAPLRGPSPVPSSSLSRTLGRNHCNRTLHLPKKCASLLQGKVCIPPTLTHTVP